MHSQQSYCFGNSPRERRALITEFTPTLFSPLSIGSRWMGSSGGKKKDIKKENSAARRLSLRIGRRIAGVDESGLGIRHSRHSHS